MMLRHFLTLICCYSSFAFILESTALVKRRDIILRSQSSDDEIKNRAIRILQEEVDALGVNAASVDTKGLIAGAVVGGVLLGPIGAFLGANVGSAMGSSSSESETRRKRLAALGVDETMLRQQESIAKDVQEAEQAVDSAKRARDSARSFAAVLAKDRDNAQTAAENAVADGDDETAKKYLRSRLALDDRCTDAEKRLQDAEQRLIQANDALKYFQEQALQTENLFYRTIVANYDAKSRGYVSSLDNSYELPPLRDPILDRFKALEDKRSNDRNNDS